jgi:Putative cell wall binding repeat.
VVSEANEHPFPNLGECLVIKFIKENDNKYYLDKDGMNGLIAYINYLVENE